VYSQGCVWIWRRTSSELKPLKDTSCCNSTYAISLWRRQGGILVVAWHHRPIQPSALWGVFTKPPAVTPHLLLESRTTRRAESTLFFLVSNTEAKADLRLFSAQWRPQHPRRRPNTTARAANPPAPAQQHPSARRLAPHYATLRSVAVLLPLLAMLLKDYRMASRSSAMQWQTWSRTSCSCN
jgi:hypothetical protein